jgi:gamma-glutamyl-gamma-aminobutyrate hydrolase PuuD
VEIPQSWELLDSTTDGIVEAVKRNNEFGVQWHPELPEMDGTAAQDWFIWKMEQTLK